MDGNIEVCRVLLKRALKKGGQFTQKIEGESMLPTLKPGQSITISYADRKGIVLGDVLVFQGALNQVVHRLVETRQEGKNTLYITKGDNNLSTDPPIEFSKVVGKISKIEGRDFSSLESQEKKELMVARSLKQARIGQIILKIIWPLRKVKMLLVGRKDVGAIRLLKKLTERLI